MPSKVLFVVTNHGKMGDTDRETGWNIQELAEPYYIVKKAGHEIVFVSPNGGYSPIDPNSVRIYGERPINAQLLADKDLKTLTDNTNKPSEINPSDFKAVYFVGGHGCMFDFPDCQEMTNIALSIYENGGILCTTCHGPSGLTPIVLSNGEPLIKGKDVTGFTNEQEEYLGLQSTVPFLLENKMKELGANFHHGEIWKENVQVDGRVITGQNPASSERMAEELLKQLE